MLTLKKLILEYTEKLDALAIDSPRLSIELLFADVLGITRSDLIKTLMLNPDFSVNQTEYTKVLSLINRREKGEPIAYLLGNKEFYGRNFKVDATTLIPRPETELIIDTALAYFPEKNIKNLHFADLGTGSGCLPITFSLEFEALQNKNKLQVANYGIALDISMGALNIATQNASTYQRNNLCFCHADLASACLKPKSLNLVMSNPPYVSEIEYAELNFEVKDFEPYSALVSTNNGLHLPFQAIQTAAYSLKSDGLFLMEFGWQQACDIVSFLDKHAWKQVKIIQDLAGLDRILFAVKV